MRAKWNRRLDGMPKSKGKTEAPCTTITSEDSTMNGKVKTCKEWTDDWKRDRGNRFLRLFKLPRSGKFRVSSDRLATEPQQSKTDTVEIDKDCSPSRNGGEYIGRRLEYHTCLLSKAATLPNTELELTTTSFDLLKLEDESRKRYERKGEEEIHPCGVKEEFPSKKSGIPLPLDTKVCSSKESQHRRGENRHSFIPPHPDYSPLFQGRFTVTDGRCKQKETSCTSFKPSDEDSAVEDIWEKVNSSSAETTNRKKKISAHLTSKIEKFSTYKHECCSSESSKGSKIPLFFKNLKQGKFPRWSTGPVRSSQEPKKWVSKTELVKEIQQLGALCESRTKELTLLKIQLRHAALGFEALAVLNLYMTEELDAFSQPLLVKEFKQTQEELNKAGAQLQFYQTQLEELKNIHSFELIELTEKLGRVHLDEINELKKKHSEELEEVEAHHKRKVTKLKENFDKLSQETEERQDQLIKELQNDYYIEREELEKTHVQKLQEVTDHHEEVHKSLQKQLKDLCHQYEMLQQQAKQAEEAFLRDTNSKIKWISAKKADLQKEVDSLKTVLEMKSSQIHDLRKENLEMKKELEELPKAKEKIKKLEAKTEDLYAMMQEKTRLQRKLSSENQQLVENYEKESRVKTRLSMVNEELQWRLQQSMEASLRSSSLSGSSEIWEKIERENSPTNHLRYRNSLPILSSERETNSVCDTVDNFLMTSSMPAPRSEQQAVRCSSMSASWHPTLSSHNESTSATTSSARNRSQSERGTSANFLRTSSKLTSFKKKKKEEMLSLQTKSMNQRSNFLATSKPQQNSFCRYNNEKMCLSWAGECASDLYEDIDEEYVEIFTSKHKRDSFRKQEEFNSEASINNKFSDESSENIPSIGFTQTTGFVNRAFIPEKLKHRKNASNAPKYELLDSSKSDNEDYGTTSYMEDKLSENSIISVDSLSGSYSQAPLKVIDKRFEQLSNLHENDSQNAYFTNSEYGQECVMDAGSLQNSFNSSSGSSWSISFAPPLHERSSSSTEDSSSYSSKSQECGSAGDQSDDKSSSGDVSGSAYDAFYITSPRNLAGEAMVQDDDSLAQVQSQDLSCDLHGETVPANGMDISRDLASSPEETKEKVAHPVSVGTPSMENSSQGMLMTDSTNMDVSWGEDEMPSECDV